MEKLDELLESFVSLETCQSAAKPDKRIRKVQRLDGVTRSCYVIHH